MQRCFRVNDIPKEKKAISHYKERMQRCFRVNDIPKEKQTDIIIYQLGEIGEKKSNHGASVKNNW